MYQPPIVNFPVFSVTWSESTDANGVTTPAVLAAGGGGAGKTGVGNKISLISFEGGASTPSHAIACELETSPELCNCVASSGNGQLMAAAFGNKVRVYASNPLGFHLLSEVRADFAEKESGVNSIAFVDRHSVGNGSGEPRGVTLLATGGEDGTLRVWELVAAGSSNGGMSARPASMTVSLVSECGGHTKPVTCVRFHPSAALLLTASKDGTCRLWDWRREHEAALLPTTSGLPSTVKSPVVMCRSCCFSPDKPDAIFSVQSGPRGNAYATEWRYTVEDGGGDGGDEGVSCTVKPVRVALVSPHPVTSLSVRSDGTRLAVGNVEGTVLIYRLPGFAKVMEHPAHDLPVTGLGFAPGGAGVALRGYDLLAGSADYKITLFKSQGSAAKLAARQTAVFLWSSIVLLVSSILWLLRTAVSVAFTVIPIVGLVALGLALVNRPEELLTAVKAMIGTEENVGLEDVSKTDLVL